MYETSINKEIKVTVSIQAGPASPAQKKVWNRFWDRIVNETRNEE